MNTNEYARDSTWIKPGRQKERVSVCVRAFCWFGVFVLLINKHEARGPWSVCVSVCVYLGVRPVFKGLK